MQEQEKEGKGEIAFALIEEEREQQKHVVGDQNVLQFLDSMDSYLTLMDSLSSRLQLGWLDLASARHSMGPLRVNSALLDLKPHSAATTLQVTQHDSSEMQPEYILRKWASLDTGKCCNTDAKSEEVMLHGPKLRHRGDSQLLEEKPRTKDGALMRDDDQVKKERSKSLSVFGTLVSPKLRAAQLSFETALETLVKIANMRSSMLSAFDQVCAELEASKR